MRSVPPCCCAVAVAVSDRARIAAPTPTDLRNSFTTVLLVRQRLLGRRGAERGVGPGTDRVRYAEAKVRAPLYKTPSPRTSRFAPARPPATTSSHLRFRFESHGRSGGQDRGPRTTPAFERNASLANRLCRQFMPIRTAVLRLWTRPIGLPSAPARS